LVWLSNAPSFQLVVKTDLITAFSLRFVGRILAEGSTVTDSSSIITLALVALLLKREVILSMASTRKGRLAKIEKML